MDRVNSHGVSLPTSEQDADLADSPQDIDSYRNRHDPHPSRPSSRLSFNRPELSTCPPDAPAKSEAIQWSRSLFQNVGIAELRLSSIKQHSVTKMDATDPVCASPPLESAQCEDSICSSEENAGQTTPENAATPPTIPRKSPSVSRLCFPFVTTSSSRRKKSPPTPPPTRHKYSCFPSLMSPVPAGRPFPKHPRHSYREHGYSRTALQNVKWFWSIREDTWEGADTRSLSAKAYDGIYQDTVYQETTPISPPVQRSPLAAVQDPPPQQSVNSMSVHPRRGDISALRDPYCAHIDRCFAGLPIWTISKTLWMYDIHMATGMRRWQDVSDADDSSDGEHELETSMSTIFCDDSDATLVESENEADTPNAPPLGLSKANAINTKVKVKFEEPQVEKVGPSSSALSANHPPSKRSNGSLVLKNKASWSRSMVANAQRPRHLESHKPQWPTNWYRRWELLVDLSRQNRSHRMSLPEIGGPPSDVDNTSSLKNISGQYFIAKHHAPDQDSDPT